MENLEYWYNYGFSGIIDDAAAMERAAGIEYITREVATFAKCDPNFNNSGDAQNSTFLHDFALYLAGRADERRAANRWEGEPLPDWNDEPLPEWVDGLHLRKQERKPEPPTLAVDLPPCFDE